MEKRRRISNKAIVIMKIISALGLLFSCCLYLFMNFDAFKRDLGLDSEVPLGSATNPWYHLVFPVLLMVGFAFVVYYVGNMIIRVVTIWRWFLLDLSNALFPSVIMIISGTLNLCTPKIIDNNNDDF